MRIAHQGEKSPLALANREIGALPPSAKAEAGKRVGQARGRVGQALTARQAELEAERDERILVEERVDVTRPRAAAPARRTPPHRARRPSDSSTPSSAMGWEVAEGPEVEAEWLNFDALNLGPDHPARQMQDTFFVDPVDSGLVLRTQTSPVQIRTMLEQEPPIYVVAPGKVFRTDDLDATHTPVFHQIECLAVDKGLTMAHLRGAIDALRQRHVRRGTRTRVRRQLLPVHRAEHGDRLRLLRLPRRGDRGSAGRAAPAAARAGSSSAAPAWSTARCCARAASTRTSTPASRSGSASSGRCSCATACQGMHEIVEGDVRFSQQFGMGV